ncbi:hypothetical protein EYF80_006759 [Liparis tanakae]|uniref:Uncharacterized protein n=1 Tax=Liparis tanakae TaxID=230148 RepID=A0A4Z2J0U1_9TELE|nr:hypothetical protein EYF80_006759 [Liparis tanakae]
MKGKAGREKERGVSFASTFPTSTHLHLHLHLYLVLYYLASPALLLALEPLANSSHPAVVGGGGEAGIDPFNDRNTQSLHTASGVYLLISISVLRGWQTETAPRGSQKHLKALSQPCCVAAETQRGLMEWETQKDTEDM